MDVFPTRLPVFQEFSTCLQVLAFELASSSRGGPDDLPRLDIDWGEILDTEKTKPYSVDSGIPSWLSLCGTNHFNRGSYGNF